ncbi:hypothetical protein [Thermovibrio sp.]
MNRESLLIALLLLFSLLTGCHTGERIYVISSDKEVLLPIKASQFFGYFSKRKIEVRTDSTKDTEELIRLLNFSKYTVVITDRKTGKKVENLSRKWKEICTVAIKRRKIKPIKRERFVIIVKERLLKRPKELVELLKGWNYGVDLLKDPAVLYYLTGKDRLKGIKFLKCQGSNED